MKKAILLILITGIAVFVAWKIFSGRNEKPVEEPKDQPLAISKNSTAFDISFSKLMNDYYAVRDALVDWDTIKADGAAKLLAAKSDSLPFSELKGDSMIVLTAKSLAESMSNEVNGFLGETDIEQKRRSFNMLTDEMYNLIRTVRYSGEMIYHIRCPMAFKDSGEAYWLNNTNKIINPYLGRKDPVNKDKMIGCGEIVDSLNFGVK